MTSCRVAEVSQVTLELMILRTLEVMGPRHGFGLAKRILQVSEGILDLNQGTLYSATAAPGTARLDQVQMGRLRRQRRSRVLRAGSPSFRNELSVAQMPAKPTNSPQDPHGFAPKFLNCHSSSLDLDVRARARSSF